MGLRKTISVFLLLLGAWPVAGQSLDIDQFSQFLRPRVRIDSRYFSNFNKESHSLNYTEGQVLVTAPVNTRIKSNLKRLLSDGANLDKIKTNTGFRFSQQMLSARIGYKTLKIDTGAYFTKNIYSGSLGVLGLKSLKKANILFYSINVNFAESESSLRMLKPGISTFIGNIKLAGLKKYYTYGVFAGYINSRFVALPFFGANLPLSKRGYFTFVLPAFMGYNYSGKKLNYTLSLGVDGLRSGILNGSKQYVNFNFNGFSLSQSFRYKLKKGFWLRMDNGIIARSNMRFKNAEENVKYNLPPGYFITLGIHYNFGRNAALQINLLDLL